MRQIVLAVAVLLSSMVYAQMMPIEHDALRLPAPGALGERVTSLEGSPVSMPSDGLTSMSSATAGCTVPIACNYDPSATSDDGSCADDCLSASPYYLEDYQTHCSNPAACNYNADVEYAIEAFCVFDVQHYADEAGVPSSGTDAFLVASLPPFSPASVTPGDPSFNGASAATLQEILDNDVTPFLAAGGQVVWVAAEPDGWLLPSYGVEDPGGYHDEYQLPWEDLLPGQIVYDDLWLFHTINLTGIVWNVTAGCSSVCLAEMVGASFTPEIDYFDILTLAPGEAVGVVLDCCEGENCPDFACLDPEACNYSLSGGLADNTLCTYDEECGCMDAGACNYDPSASIEGWCDYACTGCTDPTACEYDPSATLDNGSCTYSETCGCMEAEACNFSPDATEPAWCDFNSCTGCMDSAACNYNPEATIDMGCDLPIWAMMQSWMTWDGVSFSALEAEFEDKVILLEFGGTWCNPCLMSREQGVAAELLDAVGTQGSDEARLVHILDPGDFDFEIFQEFYLENQVDGEFFVISTAAWEDVTGTFSISGLPSVHSACPDQCASNVSVAPVVGVSPFQVDDIIEGVEAGCVPSCMDVEACNYAPGGTYDAGCNYDVTCGCMDPAACNFDENHTEAGWCDYTSCGTCTNPFADNYDPEATHSNEATCQFEGNGSYQYSCADPDACNGLSDGFEEQYANNAFCTYTLGEHLEQLGVMGIDDGPWLVSVFPPYNVAMVDSTSAAYVPDFASDYYDVMDHRIAPFLANGGQVLWLGAEPDGWLMPFNEVPSPSEYHEQIQLPWEALLPGTIVYDDVLRQLLMRETGMAFGTWMAVAGCPSTCWLELQQSLVLEPWDEPTEGVLQMSPYALLNTIPTCCTGPDCPTLSCIDPMACNFDPEGQFGSLQACEYSSGGAPCGCMDEVACNFNVNAVEPAWCDYSCIGCTNPAACNYDPDATQDDGNCLVNALCGCQDEGACNYNALAIVEGWCDYSSCAGCMNPMACDFDPEATVPGACDEAVNDAISEWVLHDGTTMADHIDDLNGKRLLFEKGGTWCPPCLASREVGLASAWMAEFGPFGTDEVRLIHLLDMNNFDDDTFEEYWLDYAVPGEYFVLDQEGYSAMNEWYGVGGGIPILYSACGTQCVSTLPDASVLGVFPGTELGPAELGAMLFSDECPPAGCMDEAACNFLPEAVIEDGSCLYEANCGCADPFSCNYDIEATSEGWCDYTSCAGCMLPTACNFDPTATIDDESCVNGLADVIPSWTLWNGSPAAALTGEAENQAILFLRESITCLPCLEARQGGVIQDLLQQRGPNGTDDVRVVHLLDVDSWDYFTFAEEWLANSVEGEVFVLDTNSVVAAQVSDFVGLPNFELGQAFAVCGMNCGGGFELIDLGAADVEAALDAVIPCTAGCTDPNSCTYEASALLDDGSCLYPDALGDCDGDCAVDADGDGVCDDEDDCIGVVDTCGICNGPGAILDCGCVTMPEGDCDCDGSQLDVLGVCGGLCTADVDGDGICDDQEGGCTYPGASNFDAEALFDDGSCEYLGDCASDITDGGVVGISDLLQLLSDFATECN